MSYSRTKSTPHTRPAYPISTTPRTFHGRLPSSSCPCLLFCHFSTSPRTHSLMGIPFSPTRASGRFEIPLRRRTDPGTEFSPCLPLGLASIPRNKHIFQKHNKIRLARVSFHRWSSLRKSCHRARWTFRLLWFGIHENLLHIWRLLARRRLPVLPGSRLWFGHGTCIGWWVRSNPTQRGSWSRHCYVSYFQCRSSTFKYSLLTGQELGSSDIWPIPSLEYVSKLKY